MLADIITVLFIICTGVEFIRNRQFVCGGSTVKKKVCKFKFHLAPLSSVIMAKLINEDC